MTILGFPTNAPLKTQVFRRYSKVVIMRNKDSYSFCNSGHSVCDNKTSSTGGA